MIIKWVGTGSDDKIGTGIDDKIYTWSDGKIGTGSDGKICRGSDDLQDVMIDSYRCNSICICQILLSCIFS